MPKSDRDREVDTFVAAMPDAFLECREAHHDFRAHWAEEIKERRKVVGYDQWKRCTRCGAIRKRILDADGYVVGNARYVYPPGYQMKGIGHVTAEDNALFRLTFVRGHLGGAK